jgi:hypothetical protein
MTAQRRASMRRIATVLWIAVVWATIGFGADLRTLNQSLDAEGIEKISIEAGVGRIDVFTGPADEITIEITLKPRRGGFFSSMKHAEEDVQTAEISSEVVGGKLYLEVSCDSLDKRFEERWSVRMPAHLALEAELGVGDVRVDDVEGGVELDVGVGDVEVEVSRGDVNIELGVGDADIWGIVASYGSVEAAGGVGGADIRVRGENISESGFIGHRASWTGDGDFEIEVEVGVGDATIRLE